MPYGAPPNIHDEAICSAKKERGLPKIVSFADRKAHAEGFLVSFMAENSIPFTLAPKLVEFAQMMSSDAKVLQQLSMSRFTASYKLCEGLAATLEDDLIGVLKKSYFSMNVDECMSNSYEKVFSILVSYFSEEYKSVVVQHYKSQSFSVVNAKNLSGFVLESSSADEILLTNVVSILCDSTNYICMEKCQNLRR